MCSDQVDILGGDVYLPSCMAGKVGGCAGLPGSAPCPALMPALSLRYWMGRRVLYYEDSGDHNVFNYNITCQ